MQWQAISGIASLCPFSCVFALCHILREASFVHGVSFPPSETELLGRGGPEKIPHAFQRDS